MIQHYLYDILLICRLYVQHFTQIYGNDSEVIDKQIGVDFPRWFHEYVRFNFH